MKHAFIITVEYSEPFSAKTVQTALRKAVKAHALCNVLNVAADGAQTETAELPLNVKVISIGEQ